MSEMADLEVELLAAADSMSGSDGCWRDLCRRAAVSLAQDWRPIETAPKDGTRILIGRLNDDVGCGAIEITHWFETDWGGFEHVDGDLYRKRHDVRGRWNGNGHRATHWMPLPVPPTALSDRIGEP